MKKNLLIKLLMILFLFPLFAVAQNIQQQINNSGFENWEGSTSNKDYEPVNWNSFGTASGSFAGTVKAQQLDRSTMVRPNSSGTYSAKIFSRNVLLSINAQGNMTTGRINAGSITPSNQANHNYTQRNSSNFNHPFVSLPDSFTIWVKYVPNSTSYKGRISANVHGDYDYEEPTSGSENDSYKIAGALMDVLYHNNQWTRLSIPFVYTGVANTDPRYMLISIATYNSPGGGSAKDTLYVDDIEVIYNKSIETKNPTPLEYVFNGNNPLSITVPYTITGAMFPNTALVLQLSDRNGSFSSPIVLGSATTGSAIISGNTDKNITGQIPSAIPAGTGYRVRVITTDNYIVTGASNSSNITIKYPAPSGLAVNFNQTNCNATLTWSAPVNATGDVKYNVYRDNVVIASNVSAVTYTDTNVAQGQSYTWSVTTVSNGTESAKANITGTCTQMFTITPSKEGNGTINPSAPQQVAHGGSSPEFTFVPEQGATLTQVLIDGVNNSGAVTAGRYTFTNVTSNHTIKAVFSATTHTIMALAGTGGTIDPSGQVSVTHGANKTFTVSSNTGYEIDRLLIDGTHNAAAAAAGSYTFENVVANHTISVTFRLKTYTIAVTQGTGGTLVSTSGVNTVTHGGNITFTITPDEGYNISQVLVDGVNNAAAVGSGSYTFTNVTQSGHTIEAQFSRKQYTITASVEGEGMINPSGAVTVSHGDNRTFTFTPNTGYRLVQVLVDGVNQPSSVITGSYDFINITKSYTIKALFEIRALTINASAGTGGAIAPSGPVSVNYGADKEFTVTSGEGFLIKKITVNGSSEIAAAVGESSYVYTFTNVITDNQTIAAEFEPITYIITASAGANGAIAPSGPVTVSYGSSRLFTITPEIGFAIDQVLVDGVNNPAAVSSGSYTFVNVIEPHTISVTFKVSQYAITASAGEHGIIDPSGIIGVAHGDTKTFTITPDPGYIIDQVLVDGVNDPAAGSSGSYTFDNISGNHTISAGFAFSAWVITASAGINGSIDPSGLVLVSPGQSKTFAITPNTGYKIATVLVNGVNDPSAVANGSYTFGNVSANHTIEATFEVQQFTITSSKNTGGIITPEGATQIVYGSTQSYEIAPNTGYRIAQVLVDGINNPSAVSSGSYTFSNVTANHTIEAVFEIITFTINATAGTGGAISPSGPTLVNYGADCSFTITPDTGHVISRVLIDGTNNPAAVSEGSYTFTNVQAAHTIAAEFTPVTYIITAGVDGEGGELLPSGEVSVAHGSSQTFTITADDAYKISTVLIDGANNPEAVESGTYTFADITGPHSIVVSFELRTHIITASIDGTGGILNPIGEIPVTHGASQTFTFEEADGYRIEFVLIDGTNDPGAVSTKMYTFINVTEPRSIVVKFEEKQYLITASVHGNNGGTITPDGEIPVTHGTSQIFAMEAAAGYYLKEVLVDGENNPAAVTDKSYTFDNVVEPHTIVAVFERMGFVIRASVNGTGGSISPAGEIVVEYGATQAFSITPDNDYEIRDVMVDGNSVGVREHYTFEDVTGDHEITAEFKRKEGIEKTESEQPLIYPNPTTGIVTIDNLGRNIKNLQIFDLSGRLLREIRNVNQASVTVDFSAFEQGVYFIRLNNTTIKILKQ